MRPFMILFSIFACGSSAIADIAESPAQDAPITVSQNQSEQDRAFDPFLFTVLGDCKHRGSNSTFFRTTANISYPAIGKDSQGRDVVVSMRLNLLNDNTYWGQYSENVLISKSGSVTELQSTFFLRVTGTWKIDGDKLLVENIGEASMISRVQNYTKAEFTFTHLINDTRVVGHKHLIGPITTDVGPHGESPAEYCHTIK